MKTLLLLLLFCPLLALAQGDLSEALVYQASIKQVAAAGGGGGDNITFRSKNQVINGNANGATVGEPASAAQNDVMIALAICDVASSSLGAPAGWTVIYSGSTGATSGTDYRYSLAWIRRGSSAPSLTWTMSTSTYREVHILCYSGVRTAGNPYEVSADGGVVSGGNRNPDCPSVTTSTANDWVLAVGASYDGSTTAWGAPSGYGIRTDNTAGNDIVISDKKLVTPGAENPAAYTGSTAGSALRVWSATLALTSS